MVFKASSPALFPHDLSQRSWNTRLAGLPSHPSYLLDMRTSTPLVYASPPSARKPAFKRRRLNNAIDAGCQAGRALTDNSNVALTLNAPSSLCAKLSCSTCHRALSTVIRPGVAGPSTCSRYVAFSPSLLSSRAPHASGATSSQDVHTASTHSFVHAPHIKYSFAHAAC